jgi:hypothetical protein
VPPGLDVLVKVTADGAVGEGWLTVKSTVDGLTTTTLM